MRPTALVLFLFLLFSCSTRNQDRWDKENIKALDADDLMVERARQAAQDSLKFFVDYFERYHGQENYRFYLKKLFLDDGEVEHMWSTPFSLYDGGFYCILDNAPNTVTNHKLGDTVRIRFVEVEDFIVVRADTAIIGHYLQREIDGSPR